MTKFGNVNANAKNYQCRVKPRQTKGVSLIAEGLGYPVYPNIPTGRLLQYAGPRALGPKGLGPQGPILERGMLVDRLSTDGLFLRDSKAKYAISASLTRTNNFTMT